MVVVEAKTISVSVFAVNPTHHFMTLLAGIAVIAFIGVFYLHFYFIFSLRLLGYVGTVARKQSGSMTDPKKYICMYI